jgi:hypothetical protein
LASSTNVVVATMFLALVFLTAGRADSLESVEVFIILLLMFDAYLTLGPIYVCRLLTACFL